MEDTKFVEAKISEVGNEIRRLLNLEAEVNLDIGDKVLDLLKDGFKNMSKDDQYRVLTIMPPESSRNFLQETFGASRFQVKNAKKIQCEKGILSTPNPKPGRPLSEEVISLVRIFYENDKVSRQMPGMKDCVSMKVNGEKQRVQKRMLLCTEYEAFLYFKEEYPNAKIGFSKFAECRPKNIVLPGASGTHSVCVCTYHQNPKLMLASSQIASCKDFTEIIGKSESDRYEGDIDYQHLLAQILCNPPQESCWMGECQECSDTKELEQRLLEIFEKLDVDEITYKQWESTDRTELVNVIQCTEEFVRTLIEKLKVLRTHDFINMMQTKYFYKIKNTLPSGTALVVGDFSENFFSVSL